MLLPTGPRSHKLGLEKHLDTPSSPQQPYDTTKRMRDRFAVQAIVLSAMAEHSLDALVHPTNPRPAALLAEPPLPGVERPSVVEGGFLGANGFPVSAATAADARASFAQPLPGSAVAQPPLSSACACLSMQVISVPIGFTETVYDAVKIAGEVTLTGKRNTYS